MAHPRATDFTKPDRFILIGDAVVPTTPMTR